MYMIWKGPFVIFYLKKSSRDIWKLRDYANIFGISEQIESILEVLAYE